MALKFRRGNNAQKSGSLAFGEPYVNTTLGTLQIGLDTGDVTLQVAGSGSVGTFGHISGSSLEISGDATIGGNLTLGGNITIGDQTTDTVQVTANLSSSLIPSNDNTFDLGSTNKKYRDVYVGRNITIDGNTRLGNDSGDTITFSGSVNSDILPYTSSGLDAGALYSLGSRTQPWKDIYVSTGSLYIIGANGNVVTTIGGTSGVGMNIPSDLQIGGNFYGTGSNSSIFMRGNATFTGSVSASTFTGLGNLTEYSTSVDSRLQSLVSRANNLELDSASQDSRLDNLESTSASLLIETSNLELFSASTLTRLTNIESASGSAIGRLNNLESTSASVNISVAALNTFSASTNGRLNNLELDSASQDSRLDNLEAATSSYETKGRNIVSGSSNTANVAISINSGVISANLTGGVISGSAQLTAALPENVVSASTDTANVDITITAGNISANLKGGVVSGSSQIDATQTTNWASGIKTQLDTNTVVSGSAQVVGILGSLNTYTQSNDTTNTNQNNRLSSIEGYTSSLKSAIGLNGTNVTVFGDLTVQGTTTQIDSTQVNIGENILELNFGGSANVAGIYTKDATGGSTVSGSLLWDATNDRWIAGKKDAEAKVLTDGMGVISGSGQLAASLPDNVVSASTDTANIDITISSGVISANLKGGVVSGSSQIDATQTTNWATGIKTQLDANTVVSGSVQVIGILNSLNSYTQSNDTTNTAQNARLTSLEAATSSYETMGRNIVSASTDTANVDITITDGVISANLKGGVISGSGQLAASLPENVVSASTDTANVDITITAGNISANLKGGVVSGSSQIDATQTTNWASGIKTQLNSNTVVSGSSQIDGTQITNNSITIAGTQTALGGAITLATITGGSGILSGSSQLGGIYETTGRNIVSASTDSANIDFTITNGNLTADLKGGVVSGSSQVIALLPTNVVSSSTDTANVDITITDGVISANLKGGVISSSAQLNSVQNAVSSSYPISITGSSNQRTLYSVDPMVGTDFPTIDAIVLGRSAGQNAKNFGQGQVFIGAGAGFDAPASSYSVFIGQDAGSYAGDASSATFIGLQAGNNSTGSDYGIMIGPSAGSNAQRAIGSIFMGLNTGDNANNASSSVFIGNEAGASAANSAQSNFIGAYAGYGAPNAAFSNYIGFRAGYDGWSQNTGTNNIVIGTNVGLDANRSNSINIGGLIFATGSNSNTDTGLFAFSGSANGRVGINVPLPTHNFEVSGSIAFPSLTNNVSATEILYWDSPSGRIYKGSLTSTLPANVVSASTDTENVDITITAGNISANLKGGVLSSSAQIANYGIFATTGSNTFIGNQTITGSLRVTGDLTVLGSSSIQNISSSTLNIGTNLITVAVNQPSVRFGGLVVIDSGSAGGSGSFLYDSIQDEFIFVHRGDGTNITSSHFLMGPETYNDLGNENYLTNNKLPKGTGKEHLVDSNITDNGTTITLGSNTVINGTIVATGTTLVSGSSQITYLSLSGIPAGIVSGSSQINHDATTNYVANQHIDHSTVSITAGSGLSGGGNITATRTLTVDTASAHFTGGVKAKLNTDGVISGSSQVTYASLTGIPAGIVSGSSQINGTQITNNSITIAGTSVSLGGSITLATITGGSGIISGSGQQTISTDGPTAGAYSLYSVTPAAGTNRSANNNIYFGSGSGYNTSNASFSNFIGKDAGYNATGAGAGNNFIGNNAGHSATSVYAGNFIGTNAGYGAANASGSNFIGGSTGNLATNAAWSNFIGNNAGNGATNATESNFFGHYTGQSAANASYSTLMGFQVGYNTGGNGIGSNNIIIGTNISLPHNRKDSINFGGIIFATGSYSDATALYPFSGSVGNGKVGINVALPDEALHVSGNVKVSGNLLPGSSISTLGTAANPWKDLYVSTGSIYIIGANGNIVTTIGGTSGVGMNIPSDLQIGGNFYGTGSNSSIYMRGNAEFTGSVSASTFTGLGNLTTYSTSVDSRIVSLVNETTNLELTTASLNTSVSNLNSFSSSQLTKDSTLGTYTASVQTRFSTLGTYTSSVETRFSTLATTTGSINTSITNLNSFTASVSTASLVTSISNLNSFSSSQLTKDSTLGTYTGSIDTKFSTLAGVTASYDSRFTTLATYTGSVNSRLDQLSTASGSAITRLNALEAETLALETFTGSFNTAFGLSGANVTVKGNLTVQGTTTQIDSTIVNIADNIIQLNGTGATNAGLVVRDATAATTTSGSLLWDTTNDKWIAGALGAEDDVVLRTLGQTLTNKTISGASNTLSNIANASLTNSSITIAGTSVSLGGSITLATITGGSGIVSGSSQVSYASLTGIPAGIVSGSSQVSYTGLSNIPAGIVSGAAQITPLLPTGTVSGSSQVYSGVSGDITIASNGVATIAANSVALGTDTTGNYMSNVTAGNAGIVVSHTQGEGSSATISLVGGVVSGSAQIDVASTTGDIALGTRTSGNYVASLVAGTNITLTNNSGEGATPTIGLTNNAITIAGTSTSLGGSITLATITGGSGIVSGSSQITPLLPTGTISGSSQVFANVSGDITIASNGVATIAANSVALGTDTTGNYMADVSAGTGVTVTHTPGEGSTATIAIGQSVGTGNSPIFAGLTINGSITATGDITAYYSSDKRFKDNIVEIDSALEKVRKIRGVKWTWNDLADDVMKQAPTTGLIAQEVQEILPEVVKQREDGYLGLDYAKMMGLMVEAIKEQQLQIEKLQIELNNCKNNKGL